MRAVVTSGTGTGANFALPAYGKTGTTQEYRDAWFVGFAGDLVVGVWVGNDDNEPMRRVTGGSLPASMWREFMAASARAVPVDDLPELVAPNVQTGDPLPEGWTVEEPTYDEPFPGDPELPPVEPEPADPRAPLAPPRDARTPVAPPRDSRTPVAPPRFTPPPQGQPPAEDDEPVEDEEPPPPPPPGF
jgi:penicillin-binding protein 1A